jgi:hypothetical protein
VTTYDVKERVSVTSCFDVTQRVNVNLKEFRMTKMKLTKSFEPDRNFNKLKSDLYQANRHRDTYCDVTEEMDVRGFEPYMLAYVEGHQNSWTARNLLTPGMYALAHVLLYPAFPYRLWLCSVTGKIKLEIRKKIETAPPPLLQSESSRQPEIV